MTPLRTLLNSSIGGKPQPLAGPITPEMQSKAAYPQGDGEYSTLSVGGIPSSLNITEDRRQWLVNEYIFGRMAEVMFEIGLNSDGSVQTGTWLDIRQRNQDTYDNNLEWRKSLGGVFGTGNNFTLGTNRRYARLISARTRSDLLSTRPFFGAMTQEFGDPELTQQVEEYVQERITASNVPNVLRDALRIGLIRNEAIVKTTYLKNETMYLGPVKVMVAPNGMPIQTPIKRLYIYEMDDFAPLPEAQGVMYLVKDPSFQMTKNQFAYKNFPNLTQKIVHYDNAYSTVLDHRDFLCPLKHESIHQADINVHFFHENPDNLRGTFSGLAPSIEYFNRRGARGQMTGKDAAKQPMGEKDTVPSRVLGDVMIADVYLRIDYGLLTTGVSNGQQVELWVMIDMDQKDTIFYDFLGNHMDARPFSVIPGLEKVPNRWYGVGVFTKMEHSQLYIDTQLNRANEKDSQASRFNFRVPHAVKQWKDQAPVRPGSREFLDCLPGYDSKNPPAFSVDLNANTTLDFSLMDRMQQASDLEFGVISSRDASASDLNQSKTATGVMSIDRDANVVTSDTEYDNIMGIEEVLKNAVEHLLTNMDRLELFFSMKSNKLVSLNRDEVRTLRRKVRLLLTKSRSTQQQQNNQQAEAVWMRYMKLNPYEQFIGRPFYVKQLKGLEVDDVDHLLPEVTQEQAQQFLQQQAEAAKQGENKPPSKNIATKYTDLARSEQVQILQQEGIKPASDDEIQGKQQNDLAEKLAVKQAAPQHEQPPKPPGK
jgi:hypothetical protein